MKCPHGHQITIIWNMPMTVPSGSHEKIHGFILVIWRNSRRRYPANTPPPPVFNTGSILGNGDLEIQMPAYTSQATSTADDYTCFTIPIGLTQDRVIKAIEVGYRNEAIVHHALIYVDSVPLSSPTDTLEANAYSFFKYHVLACGFAPGTVPTIFHHKTHLKWAYI